jgi:hypothetical protein
MLPPLNYLSFLKFPSFQLRGTHNRPHCYLKFKKLYIFPDYVWKESHKFDTLHCRRRRHRHYKMVLVSLVLNHRDCQISSCLTHTSYCCFLPWLLSRPPPPMPITKSHQLRFTIHPPPFTSHQLLLLTNLPR